MYEFRLYGCVEKCGKSVENTFSQLFYQSPVFLKRAEVEMVDYTDDAQLSSLEFTKKVSRLLLVCLNGVSELKAGDLHFTEKLKEFSDRLVKVLGGKSAGPPSLGEELEQVFDELVAQKYLIEKEWENTKKVFIAIIRTIHEISQSSGELNESLKEQIEIIDAAEKMSDLLSAKDIFMDHTMKILTQTHEMREELEESKKTTSQLTQLLEQVESKAMIDSLTKVFNRGTYNVEIAKMIKKYKRYKDPAALIVIDIDHFKKFNDDHGHKAGDDVLTLVASVIKDCVRDTDMVFRYGGEEFVVLLNKVDFENAKKIAEKVRGEIESHHLTNDKAILRVTASLGLTCFKVGDSEYAVFQRADKALYQGKQNGRNRVEYFL